MLKQIVCFVNDEELDALKLGSLDGLTKLISLLCGVSVVLNSNEKEVQEALKDFLSQVQSKKERGDEVALSYEQFNELMLLFKQERIERPFFDFFFLKQLDPEIPDYSKSDSVKFSELCECVKTFRGFALLCFGDFHSAFRKLREEKDPKCFKNCLDPWIRKSMDMEDEFKNRTPPLGDGNKNKISGKDTWYIGYLSSELLKSDVALLTCIKEKAAGKSLNDAQKEAKVEIRDHIDKLWPEVREELIDRYRDRLSPLLTDMRERDKNFDEAREKGKHNTVRYLTSDYLDVYVATSMRNQWEFEETHKVVEEVFKDSEVKDLKLRWFDPTQSFDDLILDKGLLEGLMLKRARCAIYMVQESDTLGKDSELATTLVQGKPVIAYVPCLDSHAKIRKFVEDIKVRPLQYFSQRLLSLLAERFFEKPDTSNNFRKFIKVKEDPYVKAKSLVKFFDKFKEERNSPFVLFGDDEDKFRRKYAKELQEAAEFLAVAEAINFNNRAATLKEKHPLGMQVNLETGVANGVLVARKPHECAVLVKQILTNQMNFDIYTKKKKEINKQTGVQEEKIVETVLKEKDTHSRFRAITGNKMLANSFWNFYFSERTEKRKDN